MTKTLSEREKFWAKQHRILGNLPKAWELSAMTLITAAKILREKARSNIVPSTPEQELTLAPEIMLWGYTIECLLKAVWVQQGNKLVADDNAFIGINGAGDHELQQIAKKVGVDLKQDEMYILGKLTYFTKSFGRYPIAKSFQDHIPKKTLDGEESPYESWKIPGDDQLVDGIIEKIKAELDSPIF